MNKKLLIFYSLTGNGELVAKKLEDSGYEVRQVIEKTKMPKSFFWKVFIGGFRAGIHQKGKLINYNNDISGYDEIVIGSPIWNGQFPPAINAVLAKTNLNDKKIIFVLYSGSGEEPKVSKTIKKLFPSSSIILLKEPKKNNDELNKLSNL